MPMDVRSLLTVVVLCAACSDPGQGNTLRISYMQPAVVPGSLLSVTLGPQGMRLSGAEFVATSGGLESDPIPVPDHGTWPVVVRLVVQPNDTLAVIATTLQLEPNRDYSIAITARANLVGLFACASLLGQQPIRRSTPGAPDTLYAWASGLEHGKFPPVC